MRNMIRLLIFLNLLVTICCFTTFPTIHTIKRQSRQIPLNAVSPKFEESVVKSTLGAPSEKPLENFFITDSQIKVFTEVTPIQNQEEEIESLIQSLDRTYGVLLSSSYEYPGRYARWSVGFKAPPLKFIGKDYGFQIIALNDRGRQLLSMIQPRLPKTHSLNTSSIFEINYNYLPHTITGTVVKSSGGSSEGGSYFSEEDRSKQPSIFSIIREICGMFNSPEAGQLGLYGAFGYDLTFQFEPIALKKPRSSDQADIVLFLPDEILVVDNQKKEAWKVSYEFQDERNRASSTIGHARKEIPSPYTPFNEKEGIFAPRDNQPGDYSNWVDRAKQEFKVGNLFEVVLSQIFREKMKEKPSEIFKRLSKRNPSPYGFFMNLGSNEFLIGASPEMFVRVERTAKGLRIETCPISGTIERGNDPLEDAIQIKKLLVNPKEESELTMCTDVDRNDKSRICIPGSVKVLGRRQIEIYSRLIHTVDHVEGILRNGYDALDAFLCHTWAVTVTGAPKTWAIRFIEEMEPTPRIWYGGAVGMIGFDGSLNTGLTLRTIRVKNGIAEVRAGATLLHDSVPIAEEKETELKASAMIDAIIRPASREEEEEVISRRVGTPITLDSVKRHDGKTVLLIDHEDSFVHTLANYLRQTGANVVTCRSGKPFEQFFKNSILTGQSKPDLVVLSPGPGNPQDFQLSKTIQTLIDHKLPIFGVCLGLQGLVEYFGGNLDVLGSPMHGKPSTILRQSNVGLQDVLSDLPESFTVARYHSLYGRRATFPSKDLAVTAVAEDGTIMAIQHHSLPIAAVQFHPESILTLPKYGMKILSNALELLSKSQYN